MARITPHLNLTVTSPAEHRRRVRWSALATCSRGGAYALHVIAEYAQHQATKPGGPVAH